MSVSNAADKLLRYYVDARYKNENNDISKIRAIVSSLEPSVMLSHISSKDIRDFINQRLSEGMVKSDALHTFQEYLEKVESEEIQPFKGTGKSSD